MDQITRTVAAEKLSPLGLDPGILAHALNYMDEAQEHTYPEDYGCRSWGEMLNGLAAILQGDGARVAAEYASLEQDWTLYLKNVD